MMDWEGKLIKIIVFENYISGFTVSSDDTDIYVSDPYNNIILKGKFRI